MRLLSLSNFFESMRLRKFEVSVTETPQMRVVFFCLCCVAHLTCLTSHFNVLYTHILILRTGTDNLTSD